jgi:hypothetical protein
MEHDVEQRARYTRQYLSEKIDVHTRFVRSIWKGHTWDYQLKIRFEPTIKST